MCCHAGGRSWLFAKKRLEGIDHGKLVISTVLRCWVTVTASRCRVCARYPLAAFVGLSADVLFADPDLNWRLDGLRPANHPRLRLEQYVHLVSCRPDWPLALKEAFSKWPIPERMNSNRAFRKAMSLNSLWENLREGVLCGRIGPIRCNTLIADAFLPLAGAMGWLEPEACFEYWWHGPSGDCPGVVGGACFASRVFLISSSLIATGFTRVR